MKHILFLLLFLPGLAYAQFPANPNKIRLGNQTTADGLVVRTAASPSWTPTTINNAWLAFDTVAAVLYYYDSATWNAFTSGTGGNITGVSLSNDTLFITTPDSTFTQLLRNFANSNLSFTGNRVHNLAGSSLTIADGGTYPTYLQASSTDAIGLYSTASDFIGITPALTDIGSTGRMNLTATDTVTITASRIRMNAADTRIQQIPNDNALNRLAAIDSLTGRLYYIDKSSIVTTPPNTIYSADDVVSGNRVVYLDGNNSLKFADSTDNVLLQIGVGTTPYIAQSVTDGTSTTNITSSHQSQEIGATGTVFGNSFTVDTSGFILTGDGLTNNNALNRILVVDSITNRIRYLDKASISSGGGGITGTGTTGTIPVWSGATALGDSPLTVSSTDVTATGTGYFRLPNGTTAQRPGSPTAGMTRYNTSNGALEYYGAAAWEVPLLSAAGTTGLGTATYLPYSDANGRQAFISTYRADMTNTNFFLFGGNTSLTGIRNTVIGANAGLALTTGSNNNFFGREAGRFTTTGSSNNAYGSEAGRNLTSGSSNNFFGEQCGYSTTTGSFNVAIGYRALYLSQTNAYSVGLGYDAGYTSRTTGGVYIGYRAGYLTSSGAYNVMIGYTAGYNTSTGMSNVYIGLEAGLGSTTGLGNVFIGNKVGDATGVGADKNVAIGYDIDLPVSTGDNQLVISNLIFGTDASSTGTSIPAGGKVGIKVAAPARDLEVAGEVRITDLTTDTPTRIVGADADGDLGAITVGAGLALSSGTLSATGLSYNFAELTVSGGSTSATAGTPERPDNDTPGTANSTIVGTFTASGSTLDYTGAAGQGKVSAVISFTTSGGGEVYISIYKEGVEIASTEMREAVNAIYQTVAIPLATTSLATNDTFEIRIEPTTGSNTITVHRSTMFIEKLY